MQNVLVVLNYNDSDTTIKFLEMTRKMASIEKIIVVDNCSTDNSYDLLKDYECDKIEVIRTERNGGYAYGNNQGCFYAIKKYNPSVLFISNPDVKFDKITVLRLQEELKRNATIGAIAPMVEHGYNAWHLPGFWGVIESAFLVCFNIERRMIKKKLTASREPVKIVGVVEGAFLAVRKEAFMEVSGFDARTFLYYEENIFSKRLKDKGYVEAICTQVSYEHQHSVSIKKAFVGKTRAFKFFRTGMRIYLKDYIHAGTIQFLIFEVAYMFGYFERVLYDIVHYLKIWEKALEEKLKAKQLA